MKKKEETENKMKRRGLCPENTHDVGVHLALEQVTLTPLKSCILLPHSLCNQPFSFILTPARQRQGVKYLISCSRYEG